VIFLAILFAGVFLLHLAGGSLLALSFFITFYVWNLALHLPEVRQRAMTHRYRYSFLRQMFRVEDLIARRSPQIHPIIRRQMPPMTLIVMAFLITSQLSVFFGTLGGLLMEALYLILRGHNGFFQNFKKFGK